MDVVNLLKAFIATAQTGSFTDASERLGISNRLTSKYVAELEARLGTRLLQRTTRQVGITPAGQDLLARAPALLDELDDLIASITEDTRGLSGTLRISAPVTIGEVYIKDLISRFALDHGDLKIDLRLSDTYIDLATNGIDLAFRVGIPDVASLKVRKLGMVTSSLVASPDYIKAHGHPLSPQDLYEHACIMDTNRRDAPRWIFYKDGEEHIINAPCRLMANSGSIARDWASMGHGITLCPDFFLQDHLEQGKLVRLLTDFTSTAHPLNAIYLAGNIMPRKVRALIDFTLQDIKTYPALRSIS